MEPPPEPLKACPSCGQSIARTGYRSWASAYQRAKFCSVSCANRAHHVRPSRPVPLRACTQCGDLTRNPIYCSRRCTAVAAWTRRRTAPLAAPGPFPAAAQGIARGAGTHQGKGRWRDPPALPPPVFPHGLEPDTHHCPKCTSLLAREPAFLHCRCCGKLWPIRGAPYVGEAQYELLGRSLVHRA